MNELNQHSNDEATGMTYSLIGDYYFPDLTANDSEQYGIGRFGHERLDYLKHHRKLIYLNLLTSGNLSKHLHEIEETAHDRMEELVRQIAKREGVNEKLKADDMILWVKEMNNIRNRVTEIIRNELIYS